MFSSIIGRKKKRYPISFIASENMLALNDNLMKAKLRQSATLLFLVKKKYIQY